MESIHLLNCCFFFFLLQLPLFLRVPLGLNFPKLLQIRWVPLGRAIIALFLTYLYSWAKSLVSSEAQSRESNTLLSLGNTPASGSGTFGREVEAEDSRLQSQLATCDMEPLSVNSRVWWGSSIHCIQDKGPVPWEDARWKNRVPNFWQCLARP